MMLFTTQRNLFIALPRSAARRNTLLCAAPHLTSTQRFCLPNFPTHPSSHRTEAPHYETHLCAARRVSPQLNDSFGNLTPLRIAAICAASLRRTSPHKATQRLCSFPAATQHSSPQSSAAPRYTTRRFSFAVFYATQRTSLHRAAALRSAARRHSSQRPTPQHHATYSFGDLYVAPPLCATLHYAPRCTSARCDAAHLNSTYSFGNLPAQHRAAPPHCSPLGIASLRPVSQLNANLEDLEMDLIRICHAQLQFISPYSQSKKHDAPLAHEKEGKDEHEQRTWREKATLNEEGFVSIPGFALKQALDKAASRLSMKVPGKRNATYTKNFVGGILLPDFVQIGPKPIRKEEMESVAIYCHADGKRGSGTRVMRYFPVFKGTTAEVEFYVIDGTITQDVFERHLKEAGFFVGVGRFRPENGGTNGRFKVASVSWAEQTLDELMAA